MTAPVSTPGPLALVGGGEHLPASVDVDRWLLDATGVASPHVVVVPAASGPRSVAATAALARNSWHRLGTTVRVVVPDRHREAEVLDAVGDADVLVLPGGVPERILTALGASPVGEALLARWRAGAALAGSSAGAMALFAWRLRIASARPLVVTPGMGAVDGYVAVPHFDRFVRRPPGGWRFADHRRRRLHEMHRLGVLGIDESTALVVRDGRAEVRGRGTVTVGDADGWRTSAAGEAVAVDLGMTPRMRPVHRGVPDAPAPVAA